MSKKKTTTDNHTLVNRLATAAADKMVLRAMDYIEMIEHAEQDWHALSDHFQSTELAHVESQSHRAHEADKMAFFSIGIELGRRLGGAR